MSVEMEAGPLRVAIVGLGPKGLFALEHLLDEARRGEGRGAMEIDLFEPHPSPGSGPVYDPAQPDYLRMNLAAGRISAWHEGSSAVPDEDQRSLVEWQREQGPAEPYPPRSVVGRYLTEAFEALLRSAPPAVTVRLRAEAVSRIERDEAGWIVEGEVSRDSFDEVMLAPGHQTDWEGALANDWARAATLIPAVFPVDENLAPERVPAGSTIAIRGFALTFIDACLALTEGRGGHFEPEGNRLKYIPSGLEPARIHPYSRGGRSMLAKPDAAIAEGVEGLREIGGEGRERIGSIAAGAGTMARVPEVVAETARACLLAAGGDPAEAELAREWVRSAAAGELVTEHGPREELERSLRVGTGELPVDLHWALAQSWTALNPAISDRLGGDGLDPGEWPRFRGLIREMERITFGPPPINGEKLLALIESGLIDLGHVAGGVLADTGSGTVLGSGEDAVPVEIVVDAVLPGPGIGGSHRSLFEEPLSNGWARMAEGRRGLEVDAEGSCIGAGGEPTMGLATVGRSTEDWVIDNDTLTRERHPHPGLWAKRVVARAAARSQPKVEV